MTEIPGVIRDDTLDVASEKRLKLATSVSNAATALLSASDRASPWKFVATRCPADGKSFSSSDDPFQVISDFELYSAKMDTVVGTAISHWKDLDSRKVIKGNWSSSSAGKRKLGWSEPNFVLPDNFDFKSIRGPPNIEENQFYPRDTVVSLSGNGEMQDYETELWNIFDGIPTNHCDDLGTSSTPRLKTLQLKDEIDENVKHNTSLDCHCLSRLRMRDTHHFLTSSVTLENITTDNIPVGNNTQSITTVNLDTTKVPSSDDSIILRVEFWKRKLKRGPAADGNKLEVEFRGSQTLLDMHKSIQRHTKDAFDPFFRHQSSINPSLSNAPNLELEDASNTSNSGVFFIENVFYSTGPVDYCTRIIEWLSTSVDLPLPRDTFLGLKPPFQVKSMRDILLKDIPIRLGVRYFHAFNGDLQTSVLFSDVISKKPCPTIDGGNLQNLTTTTIDTWSFSSPVVCQGCSHCIAVVLCLFDELTDGSPTMLCTSCYHKLHYTSKGILRYSNFRAFPLDLAHHGLLSVRNGKETLF